MIRDSGAVLTSCETGYYADPNTGCIEPVRSSDAAAVWGKSSVFSLSQKDEDEG